jgi:hypothetical protein
VDAIVASEKHDRLGLGYRAPEAPIPKRRHTIDIHAHIEHKYGRAAPRGLCIG